MCCPVATPPPNIDVDDRLSKTSKRPLIRIDRRITKHSGCAASQRLRKRVEDGFGWIKTTGGLAKTRHRVLDRVGWMFTLTAAAYNNLVRLPNLLGPRPPRHRDSLHPSPTPRIRRPVVAPPQSPPLHLYSAHSNLLSRLNGPNLLF